MPSWKAHLSIASKISKYIKLNKTEFLIGNLLPNYCCGEIIKDVPNIISHDKAHFIRNEKIDLKMFYYAYQNQIRRKPIILGYFIHLIVDDFFNQKFEEKLIYEKKHMAGIKTRDGVAACTYRKAMKIKRLGFKYYDEKLNNFLEKIAFSEAILPQLKLISEINVSKDEINELIEYVNRVPKFKAFECFIFPSQEIERLADECVEYVINYLKFEIRMLL